MKHGMAKIYDPETVLKAAAAFYEVSTRVEKIQLRLAEIEAEQRSMNIDLIKLVNEQGEAAALLLEASAGVLATP